MRFSASGGSSGPRACSPHTGQPSRWNIRSAGPKRRRHAAHARQPVGWYLRPSALRCVRSIALLQSEAAARRHGTRLADHAGCCAGQVTGVAGELLVRDACQWEWSSVGVARDATSAAGAAAPATPSRSGALSCPWRSQAGVTHVQHAACQQLRLGTVSCCSPGATSRPQRPHGAPLTLSARRCPGQHCSARRALELWEQTRGCLCASS